MNMLVKIVYKLIWFVAIFALIAMGLRPFGIELFNNMFMLNNPWIIDAIHYIAGIAGVLGLVKFAYSCTGHGSSWCGCDDKNGKKACPCGMSNCNCR